ncbi:hypothetical protein RDWZM_007648 [Blomia tropicalis]|uniref:Uncharacterized protein n=1 Tax=Blomia tropicalis TaxID=40697 RepID=A0A9Q0RKM6_BLOTA|nr:hypothetical protein RDWZM_007648 [Blomia tropicalis]
MDRSTMNQTYPNANELIHAILHGNITKGFPEPPSRVVKLFVSSTRSDFECERQHLYDVVVPKLEQYCNASMLDLLVIDPHWQIQPNPGDVAASTSCNKTSTPNKPDLVCNGKTNNDSSQQQQQGESQKRTNPKTVTPIINDCNSNCINPHEFELQLKEIEECSQQSAATFFICLIGHKYRPLALPTVIPSNDFQQIYTAAAESGLGDVNLLRSCYKENKNLQPAPQYVLLEPRRASRQYEEELEHIAKLVEYGSKVASREGLLSDRFGTVMSAVHQQTLYALACARQMAGSHANSPTSKYQTSSGKCPEKFTSKGDAPKVVSTSANVTVTSSIGHLPQTPTRRIKTTHRLMHQQSLQQGPTQKKIIMPQRQTSVTTNYALMQQPVDRMFCFIRQLEGVNFNNACISRFFDVTPTVNTNNEDGTNNLNPNGSNLLPSGVSTVTQSVSNTTKPLYAPSAQNDIQQLIEDVILGLKKGNVHYFNISWSPPESNSLQTRTYTLPEHYIERFGETVLRTLKSSVDVHTANCNYQNGLWFPNTNFQYPAEVVREAHSHLSNFRRVMGALGMAQAIDADFAHLLHVRELLLSNKVDENTGRIARHQPIVVTGREGAGKSTLLAQVFTYATEWLAENSDRDLVIRIVRQCGQSPSSNFASELLRSLCLQIAVAYGLEAQLSRCSEAHELSELALCLQELLKKIESTPGVNSSDLLIILDDLHHLQSAIQSSALLGWMPWHLPANVHFIVSVALEADSVLSILRSRISSENFVRLDESYTQNNSSSIDVSKGQALFSMIQCKLRDEKRTLTLPQWDFVRQKLKATGASSTSTSSSSQDTSSKTVDSLQDTALPNESMTPLFANMLATSVLSNWESFYVPEYLPTNVDEIVSSILDDIEECIPYALVRRICAYLTCTKYGLREVELYLLVQETLISQVWPAMNNTKVNSDTATSDVYDYPRSTASTWLLLKSKMRHLLKEYYVQGKLYFNWRSPKVAKAVHDRYLIDVRQIRTTHHELATAFFSTFNESPSGDVIRRETEYVREADELWYHLLYSGNKEQLKSYALLNVRFLKTIVEGVSVCYLRCILDAVRSQILDWDIEQLYGMLKQSVHVITQDASQLPVEAMLWLVPFVGSGTISLSQLVNVQYKSTPNTNISNTSSCLDEFVRQAHRICVENRKPLLYPINIWLNLPVPPQVAMITCPWSSITRAVTTPDSQHLIACEGKMLHFYHLQTKTIVKSIEGHKSTITCLHLAPSGQWLSTGSDDNSVNLWQVDVALMEVNECRLRYRFNHHSASVLCVTINHAETLVLSGSEVGTICAVNLRNGTLITRLEHHRGMVTCMGINAGDDVLVSGSTDRTVVVWSLDTFCILNEILLMRPVLHMDISLDSTFLLLSLDDNTLQVRALTTGTGVHTLHTTNSASNNSPSPVVTYVRFAEDNCRCVVGYADGRILLFDIHSARQLQVLNGHTEMITAILPQKDDHFLVTCGGNKIVIWNFYPVKRVDQPNLGDQVFDKVIHETNLDTLIPSGIGQQIDLSLAESLSISTTTASTSSSSSTTTTACGRSSRSSSDRRKERPTGTLKKKSSIPNIENHREPITCVTVSRDGHYVVTGGRDFLVKIWYTSNGETHTTLDEHSAPITCVDMAPNSQFIVSGSEDGSIRTWSLTLSMPLSSFFAHQPNAVVCVKIMSDSKRVLSADLTKMHRLWQVDTGVQLRCIANKPINGLTLHGNMTFAIGGKIENCLKYWSCFEPEAEKSVSHSDSITCFTCTHSGKTIITGSQDMSLKVWEAATAKLTQVLVGHEGAISCVANAPLNEILAVSGSQDCNLIVWDMATGADLFTLTGHNANVMGVILTPDGSRALSYSEDNTIQLWDIKETGQRLSILDVHHNFTQVYSSLNMSSLAVWLGGNSHILPIIKHHNNPAHSVTVELPSAGTPVITGQIFGDDKSSAWIRGLVPRNAATIASRSLKREQSFDSFYFEHMLHRGQSVDDFRKIGAFANIGTSGVSGAQGLAASGLSPFGSREQLWSSSAAGGGSNVHGASSTSGSTRNRMISKLMNIGPKQKMLKKQQSMFACFPEFTTKQVPGNVVSTTVSVTGTESLVTSSQANGAIGKKLVNKMFPMPVPTNRPGINSNNQCKMEEERDCKTKSNGDEKKLMAKVAQIAVSDSSVCSVM